MRNGCAWPLDLSQLRVSLSRLTLRAGLVRWTGCNRRLCLGWEITWNVHLLGLEGVGACTRETVRAWIRGRVSSNTLELTQPQLSSCLDSKGRRLSICGVKVQAGKLKNWGCAQPCRNPDKQPQLCFPLRKQSVSGERHITTLTFQSKHMVGKRSELVSSKTIERNVSAVPGDGFFHVILLYLACLKIDFMNRAAD